MKHNGIVIGGTHSGCGKTTITMGIIRALKRRGLDVQPWKAGPDYIDPGFHSKASGKICRNLDTMILSNSVVREIYQRQNCDISLIEGVMGLFDGAGGVDERGSAAHLSKLLGLPVIVVIDARAMARSGGAIALGYAEFDKDVDVAGFILNRVGSERHFKMVKESIEERIGLPVLGRVPRDERITLPERHLGLVPAWEKDNFDDTLHILADLIEETIDLDTLIGIARRSKEIPFIKAGIFSNSTKQNNRVRIAIAQDAAFHFYYEENLDLLRHYGAEIVPFSPIDDKSLPEDISAVYIGGGYPELHREKLSKNRSLINEIRNRCGRGMPLYGECGGFMYLTEGIVGEDGSLFEMLSLLPGKAVMGKKMRSLGYCESVFNNDNILGNRGCRAKGHVFHWAGLEEIPEESDQALTVTKGDQHIEEGFTNNNVLGSWVHLHFASNPEIASNFVTMAEKMRRIK